MAQTIDQIIDQPTAYYPGGVVTCYPGSNQTDDGKLQLEFNMARLVTRVSSKNFCIVKPSFDLTPIKDPATRQWRIQVAVGQASINGMDLIMTDELIIEPPKDPGDYYLAFQLVRDSSFNVLGDLVEGVTTTFKGVCLTYFLEKPDPMDPDRLYLGHLTWDGNEFSNIEEDEDKYGRIWAEDILCKLEDPKHPDDRRLNLQEWLYKVPDWYFSKEGDTVYGPIIIADNRDNNNPGIIMNVDENGSYITIKDPEVDNDKLQFYGDVNRDGVIDNFDLNLIKGYLDGTETLNDLQMKLGDVNHDGVIDEKDLKYIENFIKGEGNPGDTGNIYYIDKTDKGLSYNVSDGISEINIGKGKLYEDETDDVLHIHNEGDICIDAEGKLSLEGDHEIYISTEDELSPFMKFDDENVMIGDPTAPDLKFNITFLDENIIQQTLGKAIWQYEQISKYVSLLQKDVNKLEIVPDGLFRQDVRIQDTLYLGIENSNPQTSLTRTEWWLRENRSSNGKSIQFLPDRIEMINPTLSNTDTSYIQLQNDTNTIHSRINDNGSIELLNPTNNTNILWKDGNSAYDVKLEKIKNEKRLNLDGNLKIQNDLLVLGSIEGNGITTSNGVLTFKRGTNNATITKDNNSNILRTSGPLYVGTNGTQPLYAGNTKITGTFSAGSADQFKIDANGNTTTTGTITGTKVYGAVYQDFAETFETDYKEELEYGDVICLDVSTGKVKKVENDQERDLVLGIYSENPGVVLGTDKYSESTRVEIALVGKVDIKTKEEIIRGQKVYCTCFGTATSCKNEHLLGIALDDSKDGKVYTLLKL